MWHGAPPAVDFAVWRDEIRAWLRERRAARVAADLRGAAKVLELADRMRRSGGCTPHRLYHECVREFNRGLIEFDEVTPLYKHAMIHAGAIVPRDRPRFHCCPTCGAELDGGEAAG